MKTIVGCTLRLAFCLVLLALSFGTPAAASLPQKRVLVLYSEDKAHPAHELTDQGIREAFGSSELFRVRLYTEYLDVSRFGGLSHARTMADYLRRKYSGMKIDVIIAVYPYALDFWLAERSTLFPGVPIIAAVITRGQAEDLKRSPARRLVTGTIIGDNIAGIIDVALRMRPETRHIALVAGTAPNDLASEEIFRRGLRPYAGKIDLIDLTRLSMAETLTRVGSLSPDTVVFYSSILRDGAGERFVPREALSLVSRAATVPVFGLYESYLGFGIVGGRLVSWVEQGREAAALALRVMGGESPASIPFGGEQAYVTAYDWRELKRWGISETRLPPGSIVRYKEFSLWELYRWYIVGILSVCVLEGLLIFGLLVNRRKRFQAETKVIASERRYRTVADYTHDWEYWSGPGGKLIYISPSCMRITGYSPQEFMDNPSLPSEIIHPEDRWIWDRHQAEDQLAPQEIQFRILTREGETRWIEHTCRPVTDQDGLSQGYRGSNRDITERKATEAKIQQQRDELSHVTRVAAMGELATSLAHEINQPLGAILNYANAAQRFLDESSPNLGRVNEALRGIIRDDKRATEVIRSFRSLLKKQEPSYSALDINGIVREALDFFEGDSILNRLSIETELAPGLPAVRGDRVQLQQVILNLALNAASAMSRIASNSLRLVLKTETWEDECVRLSVRDFGKGIDEDAKDRLFESFYTTRSEGLGMGLAVCRNIIHAHGGEIWAENHPDGGAIFYFTLQTADGDPDGQEKR